MLEELRLVVLLVPFKVLLYATFEPVELAAQASLVAVASKRRNAAVPKSKRRESSSALSSHMWSSEKLALGK